jgi:hypothetical protein
MTEPGWTDGNANGTDGKLLGVSFNPHEIVRAVQHLLRAGVRCAVSQRSRGSPHEIWVQDPLDFVSGFKIWLDCSKPRPLAPWAPVLEPLRSKEVKAIKSKPRRRTRRRAMASPKTAIVRASKKETTPSADTQLASQTTS